MTLQIERSQALELYKSGDKTVKAVLEELFTKKVFMPVTERIRSFEDACEEQGLDPVEALPYKGRPVNPDQEAVEAYAKLIIIARSLQDGWVADYADEDQRKWYVWFEYKPAKKGFVVADANYSYTNADTDVGSRLCFADEKTARYFGEQFLDLHNTVLLINK